jgi:chromate transporter
VNDSEMQSSPKSTGLRELCLLFLKLGAFSFGGPAVHIAMMEEEVVRRRGWVSKKDFLDLLGATHLIPGPNSTEMAIHIGYKMAGWPGLLVAGISFIVPAFFIVWFLAWVYVKYGNIPEFQQVFLGIKPVVLAVVLQALLSLSKTALKDRILWVLGALCLGSYLFWKQEIQILLLAGAVSLCLRKEIPIKTKFFWALPFFALGLIISTPFLNSQMELDLFTNASNISNNSIFLYFAKVGSVLFGSGYVLLAFLQNHLVDSYHWMTQQQLFDAVAVGQFTPGPVFTTATFIGFLLGGHQGALVATLGIFLPAFFFVALTAPFISRLRNSISASFVLDGLNVASLTLMTGVAISMGENTLRSAPAIFIFCLSLLALLKFKINSVWLVLGGALLGLLGWV